MRRITPPAMKVYRSRPYRPGIPDPGSQGHAQEHRHLEKAEAVAQFLPGDNGGDHGDRGRNRAGCAPRGAAGTAVATRCR